MVSQNIAVINHLAEKVYEQDHITNNASLFFYLLPELHDVDFVEEHT